MHRCARRILPILACFALAGGEAAPAETIASLVHELASQEASDGTIHLQVDAQAWHRLYRSGSATVAGFPLPGGQAVDLEVTSFDLTGGATRFFVGVKGDIQETAGPAMRFFRGKVAGDPDSLVSLNLFGGKLAGFLRTGGKEYTWRPTSFTPDGESGDEIVLFDDQAEAEKESDARCDGDEDVASLKRDIVRQPGGEALEPTTLLSAPVAVEGTVEWVNRHGGVAGAQTYTLNLLSQVSAVYESEVFVRIQIPYLLMNTTEPDGYSGGSNSTSTILPELRSKWNGSASLRDVFRSNVHLFSTYPSGGSGKAYRNVLCDNVPASSTSYDYAVSLLYGGGGSFERRLVAHELGHNFSSPHSHCYLPEVDRCDNTESGCYAGPEVQTTGTMMSYCDVRMTTFHQRERAEKIRPGAEAAHPACLQVAGEPGEAAGLTVTTAPVCGNADLTNDDGAGNGTLGYTGTSRAAWAKRFTPGCHPFKLTGIDVLFTSSSVSPGRPVRLLVYADPSASGSIANATLVHSQDVTVQAVGPGAWSLYTLSTPVVIASGDLYLGMFDLMADSSATYPMDYDTRTATDSWMQADRTDVATFAPLGAGSGTWMIRGHGGGVAAGSVKLDWDASCNESSVPDQDYAVYQGTVGSWTSYTSLTCTTWHARTWLIENPQPGSFWLVVPQTSSNEGSYGSSSAGERPPAAAACKPQALGSCAP
ncbi:MAG: M12 family metallo-peptidase [Candidatus Polarisedimenticolia bacterium]